MTRLKDWLKIQARLKKELAEAEKGLKGNYKKAYKELDLMLKDLYEEFEVEGQVDIDRYLRYRQTRQLDAATARLLQDLLISNDRLLNDFLRQTVINTRESATKTIQGDIRTIRPIAKTFDTEKIIKKSIAGNTRGERLKHCNNELKYQAMAEINKGLENGYTYTQTAKNLKKRFGKDISKTYQIARTESHRVVETSKFETMEEISKEVKMTKTWHTVKDERVRSTHAPMEGVTIPIEEDFDLPSGASCPRPGETGDPAEDINCRCFLSFDVVKENE